MVVSIGNYFIDQAGADWSKALSEWSWLLPPEFTLWLVNRFGDVFIVPADGTVHMLDVGAGTLAKIAESRAHFGTRIDEEGNAADWMMMPLVDALVAAGVLLKPGQCYGFVVAPVLGGQYTVENVRPISCVDYLGACGSIHEQLRDLPEGTQVVFKANDSRK